MRLGKLLAGVGICTLTFTTAVACGESDEFRPLSAGDPAPGFAAVTLDGKSVSVEDLRGQVVLLNVWATWCIPCREEMPALQALHEELADDGLVVLGVSIDESGADDAVARFAEEHGIDFVVALDASKQVERTFRTMGVPETFLIDREGRITRHWIGQFDPLADDARAAVRAALEG
jgi:cytochrome c-type biogenesis protein